MIPSLTGQQTFLDFLLHTIDLENMIYKTFLIEEQVGVASDSSSSCGGFEWKRLDIGHGSLIIGQ